jgi:transposase
MKDSLLIEGLELPASSPSSTHTGPPRLLKPDRAQVRLEPVSLEERLPLDHQARVVWAVVETLDLSAFYGDIAARGSDPGRPAIDPRILVALWLYAATDGLGNGRELARLCESHDAYRWLCGGVGVNYHTLNDFRTGHQQHLDALFTQVLGRLTHAKIVTVVRVAQDGTRVRAAAGSGSFRTGPKLRDHLRAAQEQVEALKQQQDSSNSSREQAHQRRSAEDRLARMRAALAELPLAEAAKTRKGQKASRYTEARVSTTDPDARRMKMGDGGFRPAYNIQLAADTGSRAIVGALVSKSGTDAGLAEPMRAQIKQRTGLDVGEHLTDGGYTKVEEIGPAWEAQVTTYRPPPTLPHTSLRASRYEPCGHDTPEVAMWRELMGTPEAQEVYKERAATIETVNADLKAHRGLEQFRVRGVGKVTCVVLWCALAYNILHFADALLMA